MIIFFRNISVRAKIFGTFSVALVISLIVGIMGIVGIKRLDGSIYDMYHLDTEPIGTLSHVIQNVMSLSSSFDMAILAAMSGDLDDVREIEKTVGILYAETEILLEEANKSIFRDEVQTLFDSAAKKYRETLVPTGPKMFAELNGGDVAEAEETMKAADVAIGDMTQEFKQCLDTKISKAYGSYTENEAEANILTVLLIVIISIGFVLVCGLAVILSLSITRPMLSMLKFSKKTAETGNLELDTGEIDKIAERRDEIGKTVQAFREMTGMFRTQAHILQIVSRGDFTPDVSLKSKSDTVGASLSNMLAEMSEMLKEVSSVSKQVATGIEQISTGSYDLSNSINEQNMSIDSISCALREIDGKISDNLTSANTARELTVKINEEAENGDRRMTEMVQAVHKINEASGGIGKIMKVINDIAFQTNILALNAAVEAARAGQHGKGFSVVAEEVRNLAKKSADAAAESNTLISNSLQLSESGVLIAETTRKSLETIIKGIQDISVFIEQMAASVNEQSASVKQLSKGVDEIAEVVGRTSANAEESSAACEEINTLSETLDMLVSKFKINKR